MQKENHTVDQALQALNELHGHLTPDLVLAAATKKTSPLHSMFLWDDTAAANEHRKWQARKLIRSVKIERPDGDLTPRYMSIKIENERRYEDVSLVLLDHDKYQTVLDDLDKVIKDLEHRIESLIQLQDKRLGGELGAGKLRAGMQALRRSFEEAAGLTAG
tara:strand:+ start:111 stop:593 length:483 start_codon:yes stop_codon:yes gene_type:complete